MEVAEMRKSTVEDGFFPSRRQYAFLIHCSLVTYTLHGAMRCISVLLLDCVGKKTYRVTC